MIHTARQSPKFIKLKRKLRPLIEPSPFADPESVAIAILERLWHATASGPIRGDIGSYDDDVIAEACGWPLEAALLIEILLDCGWLDPHPVHRLLIHDWHQHAPNHVKGNVAKKGGFLTGGEDEPIGPAPKDGPKGPSLWDQPGIETQPNAAEARRMGPASEAQPIGPAPKAPPQRTSAPNQTKPNPTEGGRLSTSTIFGSGEERVAPQGAHQGPQQAATSPTIDPPDPYAAYRFGNAIGPPKSRKDIELAWRLTALGPILGEAWLANVTTALRTVTKPPANRWAYARGVAEKGSRERPGPGKEKLRELLARVPPPPDDWPECYRSKVTTSA